MTGPSDEPKVQPVGYEHAGIVSRVTYHFVEPLIRLGVRQQIEEGTSLGYLPSDDHAEKLAADFHSAYAAVQVCVAGWGCVPAEAASKGRGFKTAPGLQETLRVPP